MRDLEKLGEELRKRGQTERLSGLAASADGQKLSRMLDPQALAAAAKSGNAAALRGMAERVMATPEGRRLSAELQRLLREKDHG